MADLFRPVEIEQGEYKFYIRLFPPFKAMKVLGEVQKVLSPIISGAAKSVRDVNADGQLASIGTVGTVLAGIFADLPSYVDGDKLESTAKLLLDADYIGVSKDGEKPVRLSENVIDEVFAGRPFDMVALMVKVFQVNYLDFSKLSCVPIGIRKALGEIGEAFREGFQMNLSE